LAKSKWESVPATAFKGEGKKRGNYEEKLAVDISFEDLVKLTVTHVDKHKLK